MSACRWQADEGIIAHLSDCFWRHVVGALDGPFVVLLKQQDTDQSDDGCIVGEDADDLCAPLDFAVGTFNGVCRMQLGPVRLGEGHVGEHVLLGAVHERGELRHLRPDLGGDIAPLCACGIRRVLGEGGGDEGGHDATSALSGMGQGIAHEVDPAALPARTKNLGNGGLDAFMGIADSKFDTAQPPSGQLAEELRPDRLGLGCANLHSEHLVSAVGVDTDGNVDRDRDNASAASDLQIVSVDPQIGPFTFYGTVEKGFTLSSISSQTRAASRNRPR